MPRKSNPEAHLIQTAPMHGDNAMPLIAIDAMGGDQGPDPLVRGAALALREGTRFKPMFFGDKPAIDAIIATESNLADAIVVHADDVVSMTDKPSHVIRRGRGTSMWTAIEHVALGKADAIVSGGNTGALMAVSRLQLKMIEGVDRPAVTALWPSPKGKVVVLDVGANVEANEDQLVGFAIMGEAFFRALTGKAKPTVGLLNVGAEELKGHELIRNAARVLREADPDMAFEGFVEGNDISRGKVDVVVTDGFSGNIALKSAEGAARLVGGFMKEALTSSWRSKFAALLMKPALTKLRSQIDPSSANGGVFLGVNGIVVKSHGGADAKAVGSAVTVAASLAGKSFRDEVAETVRVVFSRTKKVAAE